ncbi:selenide, water dikinase SelD [Acetobacterium woodii]|uniref:Selenide, water dikinase n=1 Tax=Acetobacterium woodii (strain ATCC 29683 / DSM 1030 / JCM 2381 / KCTC 1655 / WB1) TaxID=931626 RepID=H6LB53_ACEWD|nr:selenide, water dikinase SelD [Acetobacterium woodii]AFA47605.1 selenophosphate synthetase SelD [Acetobacterium woodii DSM 1030]
MSREKGRPLTQMVRNGGCAAKLGPGVLTDVLAGLTPKTDEKLLIGMEHSDDAAAYAINENQILLQTLDFFTPVVDDPYIFGQIAATNSLSDIYAMGGKPLTALNIVCFPICEDPQILGEILRGGMDKITEAGALLVGGHTIDDMEPKYGLSVSGLVEPGKLRGNCHAKPGDVLILTKPIGLGIINSAVRAGIASETSSQLAIETMRTLNKTACEIMGNYEVHGCTDITGFGLGGHTMEMAKASQVSIHLNYRELPIIEEAEKFAEMGIVPSGTYHNRNHCQGDYASDLSVMEEDIVFDPQTSGGLLISIAAERGAALLQELSDNLGIYVKMIGRVKTKDAYFLYLEK